MDLSNGKYVYFGAGLMYSWEIIDEKKINQRILIEIANQKL